MAQDGRPVALVSGGSRGIGRAVVRRLAADGHDVSFCYQSNDEAAIALEKQLGETGVTLKDGQPAASLPPPPSP